MRWLFFSMALSVLVAAILGCIVFPLTNSLVTVMVMAVVYWVMLGVATLILIRRG